MKNEINIKLFEVIEEVTFDDARNLNDFIVECEGCEAAECNKSNSNFCPFFRKDLEKKINIFKVVRKQ